MGDEPIWFVPILKSGLLIQKPNEYEVISY